MRYLLLFILSFGLLAQQTVNNFVVKTNLTVAGAPPTLSVNTIADLKTLNPVVDNATVNVAGYLTAGDGGGGLFQRISSTGITNLAAITAVSTANSNYAWQRIWDKTYVDPAWFGGFPSDGIDDAAAINNALKYVWALKSGTVQLKAGMYDINTTLLIPYRVNLRGADGWRLAGGISSIVGAQNFLGGAPTTIRLAANANTNMITLNSTDGPITQSNDNIEDGEVIDNYSQSSRIENILFWGNGQQQTRYDCHGIVSVGKWNVNIENCTFVMIKGYAVWLFDANMFRFSNVYLVGSGGNINALPSKGMFIYSVSDTVFHNIEAGNFNGPSAWFNGSSCWLTLFSDSLLYNNYNSYSSYTISSWTTNTIANFSSEVKLETGDPLEFRTTGSLPTGFSDTQLYWAVKFSETAFAFHTNRALALQGIYLTGSGSDTGTGTITIGETSGAYLSGLARYNTFNNIRTDQNSGPGVTFRNAYGNHFYGLESFLNDGSVQGETIDDLNKTGILFDKDSYNNNVFATIASQPIGYLVRSNAYNNYVNATFSSVLTNIVNLSTGTNYVPVLQDLNGVTSVTNLPYISVGASTSGTVLELTGNNSGVRILKLSRPSLSQTTGIGVSPGGALIFDETGNNTVAVLNNSGNDSRIFLGGQSQASPRTAVISAPNGSGVNIAGGELRILGNNSTGNAVQTDAISILTGVATTSGSTDQSTTKRFVVEGDGDVRVVTGDLYFGALGKTLQIKEGSNAKMGSVALTAGSATVSTTAVGANSRIFITSNADGGTPGWLRVSTRVAGTSFTITSSSGTDTSTVAWVILDPAP